MHSSHTRAILQALLVTFLWATSWVLIKFGLRQSLPALTFAGLRYTLAFVCLLPLLLASPLQRQALGRLPLAGWGQLAALGVVYYTLTQGAQFAGLAVLPAATLSLLLNLTPLLVAVLSGWANHEPPASAQWAGIGLTTLGAAVYFLPLQPAAGQGYGLAVGLFAVAVNAASALFGRRVNAHSGLPPLAVTTVSMGAGSLLLLAGGLALQGAGALGPQQWLIIAWMALVNTAFAFTLWNHTLRTLTAVESTIINSTMMPQIAILAWLFLDETLSARQIAGLLLVGAGVLAVQAGGRRRA